jgi:hypothetical protein
MIERGGEVTVKRQAELLELSRASVYTSRGRCRSGICC